MRGWVKINRKGRKGGSAKGGKENDERMGGCENVRMCGCEDGRGMMKWRMVALWFEMEAGCGLVLSRDSAADGLRDESGKPGEGFVGGPCAGFVTDSPD